MATKKTESQRKTQKQQRTLGEGKRKMLAGDLRGTAAFFNPTLTTKEVASEITKGIIERSKYANEVRNVTDHLKKQQPKTKGQMGRKK